MVERANLRAERYILSLRRMLCAIIATFCVGGGVYTGLEQFMRIDLRFMHCRREIYIRWIQTKFVLYIRFLEAYTLLVT